MGMRIITPRGVIREVKLAHTFAEASAHINGETKNMFATAKNLKHATGVVFTSSDVLDETEMDFVIGNLPNEKVQEVIRSLVRDTYYDFSGMKCQDVKNIADAAIDGGASLPYCSEYTLFEFATAYNIKNNLSMGSGLPFPADEGEDLTDDGGEADYD